MRYVQQKRGWSNRIQDLAFRHMPCGCCAFESSEVITLLCMSTHANHRVQAHRITSLTLRRAWKKNLNGYFLLFARTRGSFITTPRRGTRSRKESNRERSSAHTYQSLRRGTGQRVGWIVCASTPRQIKAVGVDSKIQDIFFWAELCHADAGIAECCSSGETSPRTQQRGLSS